MIRTTEIREALAALLEKTGVLYITGEDLQQERNYEDAVDSAGEDRQILQIMVELQGSSTLDAGNLSEKSVLVDIAYLCGMDTKRRDIQDMLDNIDSIVRPFIKVRNRYFTVQDASSNITDSVGHYVFRISFIDGDSVEVQEPLADKLFFRLEEV
ncbi:MAG: hypothetical protein OSJ73_08205 [Lachnospiraceae bacterium]|nr:hypothetical protein [Lachnospiraceae bacterium]HBV83922.1 hypothetical protein [Lachnospiraceae bacterium]